MKKILSVAIALLAVTLSASSSDHRNFWVLNNTGRTINSFYIATHGVQGSWGNDILGNASLSNSLGTAVFFHDAAASCVYDFRVQFSDGGYQDYLQGRNLCQTHAVEFNASTNNAY
jgi:hypothetical protein